MIDDSGHPGNPNWQFDPLGCLASPPTANDLVQNLQPTVDRIVAERTAVLVARIRELEHELQRAEDAALDADHL